MVKNLLVFTSLIFGFGLGGEAPGQSPRSQVPDPFRYNAPFQNFGYRSPYQDGFNRYGSYYGPSNQNFSLPYYSPYGPSRVHPSYQPYLNPYVQPSYRPYWVPNPYYYPR